MNFKFAFLISDYLLFFLIFLAIVLLWRACKKRQWREIWLKVVTKPLGIITLVILIAYLSIALLDSIHFQKNDSVITTSVLDVLLGDMPTVNEKSYSAPLATHSYDKNLTVNAQGENIQDYEPLLGYHLLGTNKIGNDILYISLKSIRTGILIGSLTTLIMLPFALFLGAMAGYFGGLVDDIIQYIYTTLSSIPGVLLVAAAVLSLQIYISNHADLFTTLDARADLRLIALCAILGITSWTSLCRVLRAETLKIRELEYIQAAHALGTRWFRIINRHVLPNVMHIIVITIVLDFSGLVLAEAVLSYVGVGVDPTTYSWGNMINSARLELAREPIVWWPLMSAFLFMFVFVLSANLFADAVSDAFDPRRSK